MDDPHGARFRRLVEAVLEGPGRLEGKIRAAVAKHGEVPEALKRYAEKVALHAYKVTDEDVQAMRAAGYGEEQIFELTVAVAIGAGRRRLEAALGALGTAR